MPIIKCRYFNGYKPCGKSEHCDSLCPHMNVPTVRVLVIHLEALGAVLRSTALLPAIRRKFPGCHVTWVTQRPADQLLQNNPLIDRILTTDQDDLLQLSALEFDVALVIDKGLKAAGVLRKTRADLVFGFRVDSSTGAVIPATSAAKELWEIGLSNAKKFFENTKPETQLVHEALELGPWMRDGYLLKLSADERREAGRRRREWARADQLVVGINTGCSGVIPYKKLTIPVHRELVGKLTGNPSYRVVLLGGREDALSNERIAHGLDVVQSPTGKGLRDGIISVAACDVVVSGDSLGMHMAIALGKWTVAWFGPTCAHEIDLYGRGVHVLTRAGCSPCWKRSCNRSPMCHELVSTDELVEGVRLGEQDLATYVPHEDPAARANTCPDKNEQSI
jgi:heptosyltransferase II